MVPDTTEPIISLRWVLFRKALLALDQSVVVLVVLVLVDCEEGDAEEGVAVFFRTARTVTCLLSVVLVFCSA